MLCGVCFVVVLHLNQTVTGFLLLFILNYLRKGAYVA